MQLVLTAKCYFSTLVFVVGLSKETIQDAISGQLNKGEYGHEIYIINEKVR